VKAVATCSGGGRTPGSGPFRCEEVGRALLCVGVEAVVVEVGTWVTRWTEAFGGTSPGAATVADVGLVAETTRGAGRTTGTDGGAYLPACDFVPALDDAPVPDAEVVARRGGPPSSSVIASPLPALPASGPNEAPRECVEDPRLQGASVGPVSLFSDLLRNPTRSFRREQSNELRPAAPTVGRCDHDGP